ncbi:MAG: TonB-dependent receptor [Acidobacteria bacterium]|nr:TonB-dependent receptor [Acidobacteriota bacterium]
MKPVLGALLVAVSAILLLPGLAAAQEATISGTVTDSTGGVLPGAVVRAVNQATGNSFEAVTDGAGAYRLGVRVGTYEITVSLEGFASVTRTGLQLLVGRQAAVNLELRPASLAESVTVTGEAPLVDTSSTSLGGNIEPRQLQELPVNGRNWIDLTMLAPGSRQNAVAETPVNVSGSNVNFQINLDGQQVTNTVALGFGQPRFSRDAIAEFEFVSNRFDARQGRSSGVQVNAISKSGTNTPSGSLSGYFRDDRFNAADPVVGKVLPYQDQQISATFGGPIRRDRIHFFAVYEYEREPQTYTYTTPYPKFNGSLTGTRREDKGSVKLDFQFSPRTRLAVRGTKYNNELPYDPRYTGGSERTMASAIGTNRASNQVFATLTRIFGDNVFNEVKFGHDRFYWNQYSHTKNPNSLPGQTAGFGAPLIQLIGLTIGQDHQFSPQYLGQSVWSFRDDLTFSFTKRGRHDLKAGGEYLHNFTYETVCQTCMGIIDARGGPIPANIESLFPDIRDVSTWNLVPLSPITRTYTRGIAMESSPYSRPPGSQGFNEYAPRDVYAFWLQDDWSPVSRLTLNLGLRYDLSIGAFVNWVEFPPFLKAGRPDDKDNLSPRAGFAYSLTDKAVIRGGYGRYFADFTAQPAIFTLRQVQQIHPQILYDGRPDFAANPFNGPAPTYEQAKQLLCATQSRPGCIRPNLATNFVMSDLETPYSDQASVGIQRQFGETMSLEADYVYTANRAVLINQNINLSFDPATGANYRFTDLTRRPFADWGTLGVSRSLGANNFHGLQMGFTKRISNRWQASATYLLSGQWNFEPVPLAPGCQYPTISTAPGVFACDVPVTLAEDISGNGYFLSGDQRHRVTVNGIWDLGYGLQLSGLYLFGDNGRATPAAGVDVRQAGTAGGRLRANGTLIERNAFDLPSMQRLDLRLQRRFRLGKRLAVDGMVEVFNAVNRANYETFVLNERNVLYGRPQASTSLAYAPRMLQLGFRATF